MNTQLNKQASKLLCQKVESKLLAVCDITGIAITLEAPAIEGYALEYTNPIAYSKNFLGIASTPSHILAKFEAPILAGLYLAILKHFELVDCPMTAAAQNAALQSVHPLTLIDSIKFFSSLQKTRAGFTLEGGLTADLPHITFTPKDENEVRVSSMTDKVKSYHKECKLNIFPAVVEREIGELIEEADKVYNIKQTAKQRSIAEAILRARKSKEAAQKDLISRGRKLTKELAEEAILSEKLLAFLRLIFSGETLLSADSTIKSKLSAALAKHQNSKCKELIAILNDGASTNEVQTLFPTPEEREEAEVIEEKMEEVVEAEKPKLSIKELLAAKRAAAIAEGGAA